MTTFTPREDNGQFASKGFKESVDVALPAAIEPKFPDFDEFKNGLVAGGATEEKARALTSALVMLNFTKSLQTGARSALSQGNETHAAMLTFAVDGMSNAAALVSEAEEDPVAAREAIGRSRRRIQAHQNLFAPYHRGGSHPAFEKSLQVLNDAEEYLDGA